MRDRQAKTEGLVEVLSTRTARERRPLDAPLDVDRYGTSRHTSAREDRKPLGKCPIYDGKDNIRGFFRFFDLWCKSGNLSDEDCLTALCSAVRGDARDHLGNSSILARGGSYHKVREDLLAAFGRQEAENLSKLTALRRTSTMTLDDYITSFRKLRS